MQPSTRTRRRRRPDRGEHLGKPNGLLAPRVQAVGPERGFGKSGGLRGGDPLIL